MATVGSNDYIQGLEGLMSTLGDLPSRLDRRTAIVRALRDGAEPIRARAQELAPIDEDKDTHPLKEGMTTTITDQTSYGAVAKIGPARKAFYGGFEEFGTAHSQADPFLRPAWDEKIDEALKIIAERLGEEIEKALAE